MRPSGAPSRKHGFTLVELLVSLVVVGFMVAGAMALLGQQQRAFQNTAADRALQESARTALSEMGQALRRAGYGMEPWLAFDFGPLNIVTTTPAIVAESYDPLGTCAGSPVACRDSVAGSDEIVFHSRDPAFGRSLGAAPSGTTLTIQGGFKDTVYAGQILQVMCTSASATAYVTVAQRIDPTTPPPATTAIQLKPDTGAFPRQTSRLVAPGCFSTDWATAKVFWIDRFRYYVQRFADEDTGILRPYLMLDRGLSDGARSLVEPVAPDVEDLQFAYVFPSSAAAAQRVVGATAGTPLASSATSIDLAVAPPAYSDVTTAASRRTQSPANIRAVRVSLVVRNPAPDVTLGTQTVPDAGNRAPYAGQPYFRYLRVETTAATRNLASRSPYFPFYTTNSGADLLNFGGG